MHPSPKQSNSKTSTNHQESIQKIKDLTIDQAFEDALIISWEDRQYKTTLSNDALVIVNTPCEHNQSKKDMLHCVLLSTLFAYPSDKGQSKLCFTLANNTELLSVDSSFCMAIFTNPAAFNNKYLNEKADSFLLTNDPMALASFKWNSLEWIYFLSYLDEKVNPDHIEILNNYFRFSDTKDSYIFRYYDKLKPAS